MSPSIHALERLFFPEGSTPEQQRRLLGLLNQFVTSADAARESCKRDETWERASTLDDGRRVDPRELPARGESLEAVVAQLLHLMKGSSPGLNLPGLMGAVATVLASGGELRSEEGLRLDEAELRVVAMMSRVVGYDEERSGGLATWSARAAVLAGLRVALAKHAPEARRRGVPRDLYCFAVESGDDALLEAVETTGLGGYHLIRVRKREDGTMEPADLRAKMLAVTSGGDVPLYVVAGTGAEGSSAIDDLRELREVVDSITTLYGLRPVHIHADAAWGGLYGVFNSYDFHGNPLDFEPRVLEALALIQTRMRHLHLADSVGMDFRWLGRASFPAGLFLLRNGVELRTVSLRSLGAQNALALLAQLRAFGLEGYRRVLAEVLLDERAAYGGVGHDLSGVSTGVGTSHLSGSEVASGLAPEVMALPGLRSLLARPRN
ncbi:hypothetical protein F0U60_45880 [Archangium minus]|uniref:Uncharacterized protein n=1 Tax=Archangium minus TaxID=83450 RepID=A0ABY9X5I5_9BACT|nr:hypothetical protein F0U60_45880 [Archangium minus]